MLSPYLVENRYIAVKRCKHGVFMYNRNDAFIGRSLDQYGEWCDFEIQLVRAFIKPGDTVIDAGANIGTHTVAFANMVGPTGRVHAYEPQRRNFQMLSGNVALNGLDNVICHQEAVGGQDGTLELRPLPAPDMHFNYGAVPRSGAHDTVPVVRLDLLGLSSCSLIKIDVEGMEGPALLGARDLVTRCRPMIYVENNEASSSQELAGILDSFGYRAWWSIFWYFDQRNFYANTVNCFDGVRPSTNLICAPKESNLELAGLQPFLGATDDWKAAIIRNNGHVTLAELPPPERRV